MNIVVDGVEDKDIDGIAADMAQLQMDLPIAFDKGIPINRLPVRRIPGLFQKRIKPHLIRAVRPLGRQ